MEQLMNKITKIEKDVAMILTLLEKSTSNLTTYGEVSEYFNKTTRTIRNYIIKGHFIYGIHYYKDKRGKTVFIPKAIIAFKENSNETKISMNEETKVTSPRIIHPTASRILQGIAS